jgi:hypothetical protein
MMAPSDTKDQTKKDHGKHKQEQTAKVCKLPQSGNAKMPRSDIIMPQPYN